MLFTSKPILQFGAAPFLFAFVVLSSLAALFAVLGRATKATMLSTIIHHIVAGAHQANAFSNKKVSF